MPRGVTGMHCREPGWIDAFESLWTSDVRISLTTQPALKPSKHPNFSRSPEAPIGAVDGFSGGRGELAFPRHVQFSL